MFGRKSSPLPLAPGDDAPDFSLPDHTGVVRNLADYRGHTVVLWFYPKARTPG
jgi:peroxiredoxin Q/BCP